MLSLDYRALIKVVSTMMCGGWIGVTVYTEILTLDPDQYGSHAPEVEQAMKACAGNFAERYKCKESLIITKNQHSFMVWVGKVVYIFGPPAGMAGLVALANMVRRSSNRDEFDPPPPASIARRRVR
jgi:hypothetical protein